MSKEVKIRKHRLSKNKSLIPVMLVTLLMMFGYFYMSQAILGFIFAVPILLMFGSGSFLDRLTDQNLMLTATTTMAVFASIALLFFYYHWFKPEFNWKLRKSPLSWKYTAPILIYWLIYFGIVYTILSGNFTFGFPGYLAMVTDIAAGVCEEIAFRAVGISYMKRQLKGEKYILPILLFTSISFGLTHITNALLTGNIGAAAIQSVISITLGIFFAAVYLRTGDILPCIFGHAVHDFFVDAFTVNKHFTFAGVTVVAIVCQLLLAAWGLYLIRKAKRPEIEALWEEKWKLTETAEE